ncbi:mersacidin/lichenicidin family type 2 lantibiotic [Archangium lansingense]|uniref:mersacidin/lichenicidin family type 2 lantibiotic n=1 Tax=Archangium lansingense TaxID=2995310 RepID=UPI003B7CD3D0
MPIWSQLHVQLAMRPDGHPSAGSVARQGSCRHSRRQARLPRCSSTARPAHDQGDEMDNELTIRAWKDPSFRTRLSASQRAMLPENPSGRPITELDDDDLVGAVGGLQYGLVVMPDPGFRLSMRHASGESVR